MRSGGGVSIEPNGCQDDHDDRIHWADHSPAAVLPELKPPPPPPLLETPLQLDVGAWLRLCLNLPK